MSEIISIIVHYFTIVCLFTEVEYTPKIFRVRPRAVSVHSYKVGLNRDDVAVTKNVDRLGYGSKSCAFDKTYDRLAVH